MTLLNCGSWLPRLALVAILLALLPAGCGQKAAAPGEEVGPAPVKAEHAEETLLGEWTEILGTPQPLPNHAARITAGVEGQVEWVLDENAAKSHVEEGMLVTKDQVIVQLKDQIPRANREKIRAALADLEEQQKQAEYAVELANLTLESTEKLRPAGKSDKDPPLISRIDLEKARIALKDAQSKQKSAAAKVEASKQELKSIDEQLKLYKLRAPIAGRLGLIQVVPGQTLAIGTPVAEVIDLDEVDVLCFVAPHTTSDLAVDQPARLSIPDESGDSKEESPGKKEESPQKEEPGQKAGGDGAKKEVTAKNEDLGKVIFIAPQAQAETGNFAVKARFSNREARLRGNTVVRVYVETKREEKRLTIPVAALMEDQAQPTVVVVMTEKKEGTDEIVMKARRLEATVGVRNNKRVELLKLTDPEKKQTVPINGLIFVVDGGHGLHDGDPVKIKEEEPEEEKH